MMGARTRIPLAIGLAAMLCACTPGPKLKAAWYYRNDPVTYERAVWVDPNPPDPAARPESPPPASVTAPPVVAGKPAEGIYVSIQNLGKPVALGDVRLSADGGRLHRSDGSSAGPYVLRTDEMMILSMMGPSADPKRECLIPSKLWVEVIHPRRTAKTVKVAGRVPSSLPDEWIDQCSGGRSAMPPPRKKGRGRKTPAGS